MSEPRAIAANPAGPSPDKIEHYRFTCLVVDTQHRMWSLKGSKVKDAAAIRVACRLVWRGAKLVRPGYQGFPAPADDDLLRIAMREDALQHPDDYDRLSSIKRTVRRVSPLEDDNEPVRDFVDPQADPDDDDNFITVSRRAMRLRDRATLAELDFISAWYLEQKASEPAGVVVP